VTIGNIIGGCFFVATLYWYVYLRLESRAFDMIMELNEEAEEEKTNRLLDLQRTRELSE